MNRLLCSGTEHKLLDCGYSNSAKSHIEDWSISCKNGKTILNYTYSIPATLRDDLHY